MTYFYTYLGRTPNRRGFRDRDVLLLRRFRDLTKQAGMTLENASNVVLSTDEAPNRTEVVLTDDREQNEGHTLYHAFDVQVILEHMQSQKEFNKALLERLDQQQQYYETLLKKQQSYIKNALRMRDERLIQAIRDIQEERMKITEVAAAAETERKEKRGFWKRLFKKP